MTVLGIEERPKRRRAETVERLLDAALETFAEIGFAAASVEDICRRGGFTRGAFYSSFRTKDELFAALFERETARNLSRAEGLHRRLTALIEAAAARIGLRLTLPANRLARIVLALHDGVVIREVLGGSAAPGAARDRAASDLERTALLLLLRSATTD